MGPADDPPAPSPQRAAGATPAIPGTDPPGVSRVGRVRGSAAMKRARALAIAVVAATVVAPPADAQLRFAPCGPLECARVAVPLDRSGAVPGTLPIAVYRARARTRPARGVLLGLPGGPGDAGRAYFLRRLRAFDAVRATHDLVFIDPRGTGASRALRCEDAASCAETLGPASGLYTSRDVADDVDAVRAALGVERIALYGISYGTWLAQTYARRHPDRVSALVLDGPVALSAQDDPFRLKVFGALARGTRAVCEGGACRGITDRPAGDVAAVLRRWGRRALGGTLVDAAGRRRGVQLDPALLAQAITNLDVNPPLRAELPAAAAAALGGDRAPLLRLVDAGTLQPPYDPVLTSPGINAVTQCEEVGLPWSRTTPPHQRIAEARRRMGRIPTAAFGGVDRDLAFETSLARVCEPWPARAADPLERGPLPAVPALVLSGEADLRTPAPDGAEVARAIPGARHLVVRNSGHGTLVEEPTGCASRQAAVLLAGRPLGRCPRTGLLPRPRFPRTLAEVRADGRRARVIAAAVLTATDALHQTAMRIDSLRGRVRSVRFGGLRAGRVRGRVGRATLSGAVLVPRVAVSGTATAAGRHDLRVRGAMSGVLRVRGRRVTGTLDGRRVHSTVDPRRVGAAGIRVERIL